MECDICGHSRPLHCITCARSAIELPRLETAKVLIEEEYIGKVVEGVIAGSEEEAIQHVSLADSKGGLLVDRHECTKNINLQKTRAKTAEVEERLQLIADQATLLRDQMEQTRQQILEKKTQISQRKSDLSSMSYGVQTRRANEVDKAQQNIKRMIYRGDRTHHEIMEMRTHLTYTAAKLAGLKMSKRKTKDGGVKEVYIIGPGTRLRIYDLKDLHGMASFATSHGRLSLTCVDAPYDNLSASLGAVAQLLVRIAGYLGARLPAEITVTHNDYPQPTIFRPPSSYLGKKVPFPTPVHSSSNSPEASRTLEHQVPLPKQRTLFIDRPLPHLSVQDPQAYSLFIEGVSLLAYNIAWLCRTQGMKDEFNDWEDVCPMGRNLFRLLIAQQTRVSGRPENLLDKDLLIGKPNSKLRSPVGLGELSHATSHSFMGTADNVQYFSGWRLTPTKITDELRAYLYSEQQAQEWDVLTQKEWQEMEDIIAEDPVLVGEKRRTGTAADASKIHSSSAATGSKAGAPGDDISEAGKAEEKRRGTSGWTKLKSRSEDA
jgi:hypothetical protein